MKKYFQKDSVYKWEWLAVIALILFFTSIYIYADIEETSAKGITLWSCLTEGKLASFYSYPYPGVANSYIPDGVKGAAYDFFMYILFGIYNFPMWLWEKATGYSAFMFWPARIYIKGILWVFEAISCVFLYKIALVCGIDKKNAKWGILIFLSSGLFIYPEVVTGGYDIISVAFTLMGIYGFLTKKDVCFWGAFVMAIASKLFAFWIFVPLLLLREKRIRYLLLRGIEVLSLIVIAKLFFAIGGGRGNGIIAHSNLVNGSLFPEKEAFIMVPGLPLVIVGMVVIWIFCFFYKGELSAISVIYVCAVVMSVFVLTCVINPYWIILLTPYIILLITYNLHNFYRNSVLEIILSITYVCRACIVFPMCASLNLFYYMVYPKSLESRQYSWETYGLNAVFNTLAARVGISIVNITNLFGAVFVAALIMFLYYNFPRKREQERQVDYMAVRIYTYVRVAIALAIALVPLSGYVIWWMLG